MTRKKRMRITLTDKFWELSRTGRELAAIHLNYETQPVSAGVEVVGGGADIFVYKSGKDVITDYTSSDTIKLSSGKITKTSYSGSDVIFTVGKGTLTILNGRDKKITVTDSENKPITAWFIEDDNNFVGEDTQIDNISEYFNFLRR